MAENLIFGKVNKTSEKEVNMEVYVVMYYFSDGSGRFVRCHSVHFTEAGALKVIEHDRSYFVNGMGYREKIAIRGAFVVGRGDITIEESIVKREVYD